MSVMDTGQYARMLLGGLSQGAQYAGMAQHRRDAAVRQGLAEREEARRERESAIAERQWAAQNQRLNEDLMLRRQAAAETIRQRDADARIMRSMMQPETGADGVGPPIDHTGLLDDDTVGVASPRMLDTLMRYRGNRQAMRQEQERTLAEIEALRARGGPRLVAAGMGAYPEREGSLYARAVRHGMVASLAPEELPPDLFDQRRSQEEAVKEAMIDEMTIVEPADGVGPVMIDDTARERLMRLPAPYVERQYRQWTAQREQERGAAAQRQAVDRHDRETADHLVVMAQRTGKRITHDEALAAVRMQRGAGSAAGAKQMLESVGAVAPKPDTRLTAERQRIESSMAEDAVREARDTYQAINRDERGRAMGLAPPSDREVRLAAMETHDPPGLMNSVNRREWEAARNKVAAWNAYQAAIKARRDGKQAAAGELYVPGGLGAMIGQALDEALAEDEDERGGR